MNVDYEELEMAMATDPSWDPRFFLDSETGEVAGADDWNMGKAGDYERFEDLPKNDDNLRLAWTELWEEGQIGGQPTDDEREAIANFLNRFVRVPQFQFSHPLTELQQAQLRGLLDEAPRVRRVPVHFDNEEPFAQQVAVLVDGLEMAPATWQTEQILVIPPGYAPIATALMAELHGRMGYFPAVVRLKPVPRALK